MQQKIRCVDLKQSGGPVVEPGDNAVVHYRVAFSEEDLEAGNLLESTYGPDLPVKIGVTREQLLEGVYLGLLGMRAGGAVRRIFISSRAAYGERGWLGVPPNSDLVVEICLARVSKSPD